MIWEKHVYHTEKEVKKKNENQIYVRELVSDRIQKKVAKQLVQVDGPTTAGLLCWTVEVLPGGTTESFCTADRRDLPPEM